MVVVLFQKKNCYNLLIK